MIRARGPRFESGSADTGRLVLTRDDGSEEVCEVVVMRGVSLIDRGDSTFTLTFNES